MNLKQLEAFVRVAETKSFSDAARQLFLTQPTVSAHISSLERELGDCLLVRNTKGVALSDSGKELYAYAVQMLELEQKIRDRFGLAGKQQGSVLRIAASTVPAQYLLPEIMTRFSREYPDEQLKLFESDSSGVAEMILSHRADIGFTGTVLDKGNCTYVPFYEDELVVLTPVSDVFRQRLGKSIASWILEEPVILREDGSGTRKEAMRLLRQIGIDPEKLKIAAVMENQETIKRSAAEGMGVAILSRLAAKDEIDRGTLLAFPFGENGGKRNINMVYDTGYPSTPAAEKFIKTVRMMYLES